MKTEALIFWSILRSHEHPPREDAQNSHARHSYLLEFLAALHQEKAMSVFVWTVGDVIAAIIVAAFLIALAFFYVMESIQRALCKHDGGVNETSACDAICRKCGKNLGFIGDWRKPC